MTAVKTMGIGRGGARLWMFVAACVAVLFAASAPAVVSITTSNLQPAVEIVAYQQQISASGANLIWSLSGTPPAWLSIQSNTGLLSGTPPGGASTQSPYNVTVSIFDATNPADTDSKSFALSVSASGGNVQTPNTGTGGCALGQDRSGPSWGWLAAVGLVAAVVVRRRFGGRVRA